jgi:hypothetical protein
VVATYGGDRPFVEASMTTAPAVPDRWSTCRRSIRGPEVVPRFIRNFDHRRVIGSMWWKAGVVGPRRPQRLLVPLPLKPQRLADGRLDPLALPPLIDTMPPALCAMVGPDARAFLAPSLDLTVHFMRDTTSEWLLTHAHCREARGGYATADLEVWDEARRLVAVGTQVMILRRRPGG